MKLSTYEAGGRLLEAYLEAYAACDDVRAEEALEFQALEIGYDEKSWQTYTPKSLPLDII